jgi:integrase
MSLRWVDVDTTVAKALTLPAAITKTGKKRQLPLTDILCEIISRRRQSMVVGNPYVFQGMHGRGQLTEPKRAVALVKAAIEKAALPKGLNGIDWSPHDLRRTYATTASRLDVSYYKLKHLLGHSVSGDVTGNHYVQVDVETLRQPAQEIANFLKEKMGIGAVGKTATEDKTPLVV